MIKGVERYFNSEYEPGRRPNCVGYVLYQLEIIDSDRFVDPGRFESYSFFEEVADVQLANAIAIMTIRDNYLYHLALIDKDDPNFVVHRPATGAEIIREKLLLVYEAYQGSYLRSSFVRMKSSE